MSKRKLSVPEQIGIPLRRWSRMHVTDMKWKWSEVRVYCDFGWYSLHTIVYPGHYYNRFPLWLSSLDNKFISPIIWRLNYLVIPYQKWLYRRIHKKVIARNPEHRDAIISGADYPELIDQ